MDSSSLLDALIIARCLSGIDCSMCERYIVGIIWGSIDLPFPHCDCHNVLAMPVATYFAALFATGPEIWTYPKWQERTNFVVPPFAAEATPTLTGLSEHDIRAVKALSDKIHGMKSYASRVTTLAQERDNLNDIEGRRAWQAWMEQYFAKWKLIPDIEGVLMEEDRHPHQLIGQQDFVSAEVLVH